MSKKPLAVFIQKLKVGFPTFMFCLAIYIYFLASTFLYILLLSPYRLLCAFPLYFCPIPPLPARPGGIDLQKSFRHILVNSAFAYSKFFAAALTVALFSTM